ncbi:ArsR family transcriptional regulator [Pengzhenrongella frigida]|uniref:ArsR family transcriptional regulator n=2 Tax=Pengzhenrongella frigida TaxID=1259133 RepID=A0A4Q5N0W4_9MICO|nr:ArsR family transcriptional regulator [Cellulomonas sp. HLT2-17]
MSSVKSMCCSPVLAGALTAPESQELALALKVLADPVRLRLLGLIRSTPGGRALTRDLVESLDVTQPTISHHLGVLFDAGFVEREREGRETWYSIEPDSFTTICQLLDPHAG